MENSSEFPQKLKTDLSSYSTPGYTSKENENRNSKMHMQKKKKQKNQTCISIFIPALFMIAKIWKQHKCPTDEWIKKLHTVHTYNGTLLNHEKRMRFCHLQQNG